MTDHWQSEAAFESRARALKVHTALKSHWILLLGISLATVVDPRVKHNGLINVQTIWYGEGDMGGLIS